MIKYSIRGENLEVTEAIRDYVVSKLEKIEKYMRLTKMPETDYYDISIGEITALVHMEDVFAAIARAYDFGRARGYRMHAARSKA